MKNQTIGAEGKVSHISREVKPLNIEESFHRQETTDTIVYEIVDYTTSLEHAHEMLQNGWHVTSLTYSKKLPRPKPNCHDILLMEGC